VDGLGREPRAGHENQVIVFARVALQSDDAPPGPCARVVLDERPTDVDSALKLGSRLGRVAPSPGDGSTRDLWEALATLAAMDLGAVRAVEPHVDAQAILRQAGSPLREDDSDTWGVFAAEGGDRPVLAVQVGDRWQLSGVKPWCSLAARLSRALITARLPDGRRGLFAIELRQPGITAREDDWNARGLSEIPSGPIILRDIDAVPVGGPDWYLSRPGFAWGGIGVAACWFGGLVAIARTVFAGLGESPGPLQSMVLGRIDGMVEAARRALAEAAVVVDARPDADGAILAKRVRSAVAQSAEGVLVLAGHALGPAPLALDASHAKRVADLQLYVRQHHAEKDDASLGASLGALAVAPW
jgi:alkylation response protein AidB-like acyl-CoA dehydrogenase